jgi:two-component system, NarL family, response regulator NreC
VSKIQVVIADDHPLVLGGLHALISAQSDMEVVGDAKTMGETLRVCRAKAPDVLTLDLTMPNGNGINLLRRLREECPKTRALIVTVHDDPAYIRTAMEVGAAGYVVKTVTNSELLAAIHAVHKGLPFVLMGTADKISDVNLKAPRIPSPPREEHTGLSAREQEVLTMLVFGHTSQQIADSIERSVKTVETYRARIAEKLGLRSRADYIRYGLEKGILKKQ